MQHKVFRALALVVCCFSSLPAQNISYPNAHIIWDASTLTLVQAGGGYGRMVRLADREILCSFEWNGAIYVRRSADEGQTWSDASLAASFAFGTAANPELLVLQDGSILLSYNERPTDGVHPYTIKICFSRDNGATWQDFQLVYQAGLASGSGCWEPAQVQLPSGEIQLYFSNENPYPLTGEQQITLVRSFDNGATWTAPQLASFRPGHRDGMPVPLALAGNSQTLLSIEDNGLAGAFKPAVVTPVIDLRWAALAVEPPSAVYAGAPYLRQFPSGETVLSVQSAEGRSSPGTLDYSRMVVYTGDSTAHGFTNSSEPFAVPAAFNGLWNSLFIKNPVTVTAISGTTLNGVSGLWSIDGRLTYGDSAPAPSIESVTNLAGVSPGPVAPGELVSLAGSGLVPRGFQPGAVTAYFNGIAAPALAASAGSITALVPDGVTSVADVVLDYGTTRTYPFPLGVTSAAPEIFTQPDSTNAAVAANTDGTFNSAANPAPRGSYLSFWVTGQGSMAQSLQVALGGVPAEVTFAGLINPGVLQVNVKIPEASPVGAAVPLTLTVGNISNRKAVSVSLQ